jgi:small ligand-binding sensory domain FIST
MTAGAAAAAAVADGDALEAARQVCNAVAGQLGPAPDLAVLFIGATHAPATPAVAAAVAQRLDARHLVGVTAGAVLAGSRELEEPTGLALWAAHLPGARIEPVRFAPPGDEGPAAWTDPHEEAAAVVLVADPFTFPADAFLSWLAQRRPGLPVTGGLASAGHRPGVNRLVLDGEVHEAGAVGVALSGVPLRTLVSQGCRPIGSSYIVTRAERNLIQELGGAAPVERIKEAFADASREDRDLMREGLHIGLVLDEYQEDFARGDFLVRGVLGAQTGTGALAVGDVVRVGQTVQFHVRDAGSADEDLRGLLQGFAGPATGALLFTCNGRGRRLFSQPDHDAALLTDALGGAPVAGFFCAGELGPVGGRSFLHGFTASALAIG